MADRVMIKERAKELLRDNRGAHIGAYVVFYALSAIASGVSLGLGAIFLVPPLTIGFYLFNIQAFRGERPTIETIFTGFSQYTQALGTVLLSVLRVFFWSLLLIIPGIIMGYAYFFAPYLAADYPNISPSRALSLSVEITRGHRMEIFVMQLSFIGWSLLALLTLGISLFVHTGPYMQLSLAGLYDALLREALEDGTITEEELQGA